MSAELKVNVHKRALRAAERVETNGKLHGFLDAEEHLPDSLPVKQRWRDRLRAWWYRFEREWEPVVVNKHVDSITMPKWIASSILATVLLFGVSSWWRASDQRDMLIELKTELRLAKEHEAEKSRELKEQAELNKVYIDNTTNQLNIIKGMLSVTQLSAVDAAARKERN